MARKRVEKNIAKDDKRNVYYVYLYYGTDAQGKAIRNTVTTSSLKEAKAKLKEHKKQMQAGTAIPPARDTLSECMKDFIDYKAALLAESTIYGYTNIWKNHIAPYFEKKRIQDVTAKDIQDYIGHKSKTALSNASIKKHLDLMYSVFHNAYINRLINENPMDRMDRFKAKSSQMDCMNMNEIAQLCLSVKGTQLEVPVVLAAYLGLRRGEILGLKWEHIDFENATLYVENTRTMVGKKVVEKSPKTERSTRQLNLNDYLLQMLLEHKNAQHKNLGHTYVVTMKNGKAFRPNYLSDAFLAHLRKHGMKEIRFHDLRHSFASIANEAGTPMNEISAAMGHSNISVTSGIYTHEFSKKKTKAVNAVANCIESVIYQGIPTN